MTNLHPRRRWLVQFVESKCATAELWTAEQVLSWMCGIDLPPVGQSELPFVWIWKGIESSSDSDALIRRFAEGLRACADEVEQHLLPHRSDVLCRIEGPPGEAASNLWSLMALLKQPDLLGAKIRSFVEHFNLLARTKHRPWLCDEQLEPIRQRLLSAAIFNQDTDQFVSDWKLLASGESDRTQFQAGYRGDGIEGLLHAPGATLDRMQDLGQAIACFSHMGPSPERRKQIIDWLARIRERFATDVPAVDERLIQLADQHNWPRWVVRCLGEISPIPVEHASDGKSELVYVWTRLVESLIGTTLTQPIASVMPPNSPNMFLCEGEIIKLRLSPTACRVIQSLSRETNGDRIRSPFSSIATAHEIIHQAIRRRTFTRRSGDAYRRRGRFLQQNSAQMKAFFCGSPLASEIEVPMESTDLDTDDVERLLEASAQGLADFD